MTLIYLVPGHRAWGEHPRFIALSQRLIERGHPVHRFDFRRALLKDGSLQVTDVTEEVRQVKEELEALRDLYEDIVVVGHSQGGIVVAALAAEGIIEGGVSLMGVVETEDRPTRMMERHGRASITDADGIRWTYSTEFYEDYPGWDVKDLLSKSKCPLLFVAAEDDDRVPAEEVRFGFEAAAEPKEFVAVPGSHVWDNDPTQVGAIADAIAHWLED